MEVTPVGSQMVSFFELIKITNKKDHPKAKAGAAYPQRILARITSGPKWSQVVSSILWDFDRSADYNMCNRLWESTNILGKNTTKTFTVITANIHYPPGKLNGTVPPSSGARISRTTDVIM